ncbi:MAG: hypothetical protein ABI743_02100 [bacterium]
MSAPTTTLRLRVALLLLGPVLGASLGCARPGGPKPQTPSAIAVQPFESEQGGAVVKPDPATLYSEDQLAPIWILSEGALPSRIAPLTEAILSPLIANPASIERLDLRIAHAPDQWPKGPTAEATPMGSPLLVRLVYTAAGGRLLQIQPPSSYQAPGEGVKFTERTIDQALMLSLLTYLQGHHGLWNAASEVNPAEQPTGVDDPWLSLSIKVRTAPATVTLVPRKERDDPAAEAAESLLPTPATPPSLDAIAQEIAKPREWVDESPDGVQYMEAVDAGAQLYTFTIPVPATPNPELTAWAQVLVDQTILSR